MEKNILVVLNELLESSSSSSDDDDIFIVRFLLSEFGKKQRVQLQNFIDVIENFSEAQFREHFRLKRSTAEILITRYENSEYFKRKIDCGGRREIPARVQILAFLWFAGNKDSYRDVSKMFNISISSIHRLITSVLDFIYEISKNFIKFPSTDEEKTQVATKFEQIAGFPDVLGCIAGCYLSKPANKAPSANTDRRDPVPISLQGICDAEMRFVDVFVCAPSKISNTMVFQLSFIRKDLPGICGKEYHILGDTAYPLTEYLMTPYKDTGYLSYHKRKYNKKHCKTREKIEDALSLIKMRFRQLLRLDFQAHERVCKFVLACCVLHNLCIDEGDLWDIANDQEGNYVSNNGGMAALSFHTIGLSDNELRRAGEIKRTRISASFS